MDQKSRYENLIEQRMGYKDFIFIILILASIFFIGLGVGLLIKPNKSTPIIIDRNAKIGLPTEQSKTAAQADASQLIIGNFIASVNGKSYYPKDCPSAKRIKEENKIWFNSNEEAETQGYKLAQNCP